MVLQEGTKSRRHCELGGECMSPVRVEIPVFVMLREYPQEDGVLVPIEFHGKDLPFVPKRAFFIRNVPEGRERGNHAHKRCYQFIIPICGTIDAHIKNKYGSFELTLDSPRKGLLV